jgi:hypothetical protein
MLIHEPKEKATDTQRRALPASAVARKPSAPEYSGTQILGQRLGNQGVQRLMREIAGQSPGSAQTPVTSPVAANIQSLRGGGSALPPGTRAFFEQRFGADFGDVRVHTDTRAADTAEAIDARAFTVGRDIVFGPGQYGPETSAGQHLLAHELTHVVQQEDAPQLAQRWEGLEHKKVGNRAQNEFPFRGTIPTDMTALRATPAKDPSSPHSNTKVDLLRGAQVLALGKERGWVRVLVESGRARDKKGSVVSADTMTGYVSHELVTKSAAVFDSAVPVGGGLDLSYGDLVAFGGDHFKDVGQLTGEASSPAGRTRLKQRRDLTDSEATKSPAYEDAATISKEYAERYKSLALENVSHFSGGGTALSTWQETHRDAVLAALDAGKKGDSGGLGKAYAMNAFADHFLTDSFSAGHVRVPREQTIVYYKKLARDVFQNIIDYLSTRLGSRIYDLLRRDYARVRQFGGAADRRDAIARVRAQITQSITDAGGVAKVREQFGLYVAGAFAKIMHDEDNTSGLKVVSKNHPEGWTAFGDARLEAPGNAKNLAYMTEAVRASKQDLLTAFTIGVDVLTRHGKTPSQAAIDAAMAALTKKVGPPYAALAFAPSAAPGVKPLPAWEWGKLDPPMKTALVGMIAKYLTTTAQAELLAHFPVRQEVEITGPNVDARPREAATDIMNELLANPVQFLEQAFGRSAGP